MVSDTEFEKRSKVLFDESVDGLNGQLSSRLARARYKALAEAPTARLRATRRFWMPAAGFAAAALIAVLVMTPYTSTEQRALPATFASADDMALLLNDDDLAMIEDMEFYAWLDSDLQALPESPAPPSDDDANS